jgi:ABC-type transporter Mla MlaB component
VLRITRQDDNGSVALKLEGKLLAAWTDELLSQIPAAAADLSRTRLDLSQLSFADAAGLSLLRRLIESGVSVESTSSFIAELLHTRK